MASRPFTSSEKEPAQSGNLIAHPGWTVGLQKCKVSGIKLHLLLTFCKPSGRARYSAAGRSGGGGSHLNSQLCSFAHNPHSVFLRPKVPDSITSQAFPVTAPRSHLLSFWFLEAPFSFETSFSSTTPTPLRPFLLLHHPIHDPTWPALGPPPQISPTGQPTRTVPNHGFSLSAQRPGSPGTSSQPSPDTRTMKDS